MSLAKSSKNSSASSEVESSQDSSGHHATAKFYHTKTYIPPLERQSLRSKISPPACSDISNSSSDGNSGKRKRKTASKNKNSSLHKENKKPPSLNSKSAKEKHVDPTVFLSKKVQDIRNGEKKFFKTRTPETLREMLGVNLTREKIVPVDVKGLKVSKCLPPVSKGSSISSSKIESSLKRQERAGKENVPWEAPQKKATSNSKWLISSFSPPDAEHADEMSHCQSLSTATMPSSSSSSAKSGTIEDSTSVTQSTEQTESNKDDDSSSSDFTWTPRTGNGTKKKDNTVYPVFKPKVAKEHKKVQKVRPLTKTVKLKPAVQDEENQLMLDAGQKEIGAKECPECSMVYHIGNVADENLHAQFHDRYLNTLRFHGWKKERVVGDFIDGRVIMVTYEEPSFMIKKVEEILTVVNRELGAENSGMPTRPEPACFLFCSIERKIIGVLVAESITYAYCVEFLDKASGNLVLSKESDGSLKSVEALCGIYRLWVAKEARRQKIASRMMDCLRCNYLYGYPIPTKQIAFLEPSSDAMKFFARYSRKPNILVYK